MERERAWLASCTRFRAIEVVRVWRGFRSLLVLTALLTLPALWRAGSADHRPSPCDVRYPSDVEMAAALPPVIGYSCCAAGGRRAS